MMRYLLFSIFLTVHTLGNCQESWEDRMVFDPALQPFYHGVASGDPTSSSVILWTRVTPDDPLPPNVQVNWRISTTVNMTNVIQSGTIITDASKDYTLKVDVEGLNANTFYYYDFNAIGLNSVVGRTKTLPALDDTSIDQVRFAVVSCSRYDKGYFNGYRDIVGRNDIDAILHLGDYIYEYGDNSSTIRPLAPDTEIISLADYRTRYSFYRLDPDLRDLHQQYPFYNIWDDHESANNAYQDGASNHNPNTEGPWEDRKSSSMQAFEEWLPIRATPTIDSTIYRSFKLGDFAELFFLDTRLIGRSDQDAPDNASKTLLGQEQFDWLVDGLNRADDENTRWKIIAQQVMMAPLEFNQTILDIISLFIGQTISNPINDDQWDGYNTERNALLGEIKKIDNVIVLTGDFHSSWANDIPLAYYTSNPCTGSAGVEFVTTSITSPVSSQLTADIDLITVGLLAYNDHMKYVDLRKKGYMILDLKPDKAQADWYYVNTITSQDYYISSTESWYVNAFERCVQSAATPTLASQDLLITEIAPEYPLAIELAEISYFDAWQDQGHNQLVWHQAKQWNTDGYFVIERSHNGLDFHKIGQVDKLQSDDEILEYEFLDLEPILPLSYYRVVFFSTDGSFVETAIRRIEQLEIHNRFDFYPNPTRTNTNCYFYSEIEDIAKLKIYTSSGQLVELLNIPVQIGHNRIPISLEKFGGGHLTLSIETQNSNRFGYGNVIKVK